MTPGQCAFEAWKRAIILSYPVPAEWADLETLDREAWEAAAKAVRADAWANPPCHCTSESGDSPCPAHGLVDAEHEP